MIETKMKHQRRSFLAGAGASAALVGSAPVRPAIAQAGPYPNKPIRLVVAYPPGNSSDLVARFVAERMMPILGQAVIVDNRGGAGGTIGTEHVARQAPDGYAIGISNAGPLTIAPGLYQNLAYDPVRDFTHVAPLAIGSHLFVVHPSLPVNTIQDLIAYAKAHPGRVLYGSSGNGSTAHLAMALFAQLTGVELTHVPYRGSSAAMNDLLAGRITLASDTLVATTELVRTGRLRALGVTSKERSHFVPDIAPIAEQGVPDYDFYGWIAVMGPAGMPEPAVQKIHEAVTAVTRQPGFESRMGEMGLFPMRHTRAQLREFVQFDVARWRTVISTAGIRIEG
ncbi:tripartite tricarboxylate transporter substrate binding protein [Roseomonas hellenica]|uniref:Tripartite tricarboxylate transporter substrate binding protein n=1 Tax=Plastoroseomonas hellenica TaxID=2687306 RepID=A0ABS5F4D4_9PROT|nr:tripartite tricarboxylate transporter substrate binding protein [Plastoroseomonas hellenica]MBR0667005.1 tripartite tricarboxylate transporter substrate binding protein [Plastoroseomonas hellenica]